MIGPKCKYCFLDIRKFNLGSDKNYFLFFAILFSNTALKIWLLGKSAFYFLRVALVQQHEFEMPSLFIVIH